METNNSPLTLAELWAYACCPYRYFWRYVARIAPAQTARGLVEATVRQASSTYYGKGEVPQGPYATRGGDDLVQCVGRTWREMVREWGCAQETWDLLVDFATRRARVLEPFVSGRVTKRDGTRYKVPEMSKKYERRAREAGLPQLGAQLDERLANAPVRADEDYSLARAFSDSVEIASRSTWPGVNAVVGADLPYEVELTDGHTLEGRAELVTRAAGREVNVEVHDYDRPVCLPVALLRRDLRVVAGLHAQSREWAGVRSVVYRHMRSGASVSIRRPPGKGRLLTALVGVAAGIRHHVYVPRLAVQSRECLSCPFQTLCTDGPDVLDTLDPTLLAEIGILVVTQEHEEGG
ncbi:MAG: hypothetical protein U9R72_09685 [Chloroflexota bacterium]|nr:hypothetical protein [Chloroflexota bacterium]